MTQSDKDLLLKDLCARLPYGVKVEIKYHDDVWKLLAIYTNGTTYATRDIGYPIETYFEDCKPYLFPISSMTEEQLYNNPIGFSQMLTIKADRDWENITINRRAYYKLVDWFNKNHFDYRGLIEEGLAIDATGLNIY